MSPKSKQEYVKEVKSRYQNSSKLDKQTILDELCNVCHYNRKYAIRLLNHHKQNNKQSKLKKRGRKSIYDHPLIKKILYEIWIAGNLPCSKRLKAMIPIWLPHYSQHVPADISEKLLMISHATIDRLMKPQRHRYGKQGLSTTKPGSLLKKRIPIKTNQWDETHPGFCEADTVAHCGNSVAGQFAYTINIVDLATSWTEQRAVWGKGEIGVINAIKNIERAFPFPILGFDCDNGSEFLNWHLFKYLTGRKNPIQFTRSRAYYKNDNAHIEGKNWTHIRQYLGYQRFEKQILVTLLDELYTTQWNRYFNFFMPTSKLIKKSRVGSKIVKKYDQPKTPLQRILESNFISHDVKERLIVEYENLNPFMLQKQMLEKIKKIIFIVNQ